MAIATSTGLLIAAGLKTGASLYGASKQSSAAKESAQLQREAQQEALAFAREQAEADDRRYEEEQARLDAAWEAEQARREPLRQAGLSVLSRWGFDAPSTPTGARPEGWMPGMAFGQGPGRTLTDYSGLALGRTAPPDITPALQPPRTLTGFMEPR